MASEAATTLGAVAVGLHTDQRRLMGPFLTGIAKGMVQGVRQPGHKSSQG